MFVFHLSVLPAEKRPTGVFFRFEFKPWSQIESFFCCEAKQFFDSNMEAFHSGKTFKHVVKNFP